MSGYSLRSLLGSPHDIFCLGRGLRERDTRQKRMCPRRNRQIHKGAPIPVVVSLVFVCRAIVDRLVHDRAPHSMKLHQSGSLLFPLREGRPLQMHLEGGGVRDHFVHAELSCLRHPGARLSITVYWTAQLARLMRPGAAKVVARCDEIVALAHRRRRREAN